MIPEKGWKPLKSAPKDGTIVIGKYRQYNDKNGKFVIQAVQWFCDEAGASWGWKKPWHTNTTAYVEEWMTYAEFQKAQETKNVEFDL